MSQRIALTHRVVQRFDRRVRLSTHWLRLRPAPNTRARIEAYSLHVAPESHFINWIRDPYENDLARLDLPEPLGELRFDVDIVATLDPVNPFDFFVDFGYSDHPFEYTAQVRKELAPYLRLAKPGPRLRRWLEQLELTPRYIVEFLGALNRQVMECTPPQFGRGGGHVDVEAVLQRGSANAWERAWLLTLSLRHAGLAARFTSGYHVFLSSDTQTVPDSARMHAWSEVFLPGAGWIGLDPTSGTFTGEGYIPLASAPDPLRALPWIGYCEACGETGEESIRLRRLEHTRDRKNVSDSHWADVRAVAADVDARLKKHNVALSISPRIAFVHAPNAAAPEWTTGAMSDHKRTIAEQLASALRERVALGGVFHVGQTEWFNSETLPRWRISCLFRADGRPVWSDAALNAWPATKQRPTPEDVKRFSRTLTRALGINVDWLIPAHEDALHELWRYRGAFEYEPQNGELKDPHLRRELAERLSQARGEPVGYVLPLHWDSVNHRWISGAWMFRRRALYLMPGTSALGFRLPLDALPVGESILSPDAERCQFDERSLLPDQVGELSARFSHVDPATSPPESADAPYAEPRAPRTALCIELRDGRVWVFMPPLTHAEHYLDLVAAIEAAARDTGLPVLLEGYDAPEDHRLPRIIIEPDAGTLNVTLPPAAASPEQFEQLQLLYSIAEELGLRAERYDTEGRRLPPGGDGAFILGGTEPARSPFLQRPELLRDLITCWQRHPSLSYFFAGRDVGPGRAAPRPDEGRDDALYELGVALERIPSGTTAYPWMPDRLLRHLLADASGNMRRAEIRVDQLYAPDRPGQRLGRAVVHSMDFAPKPYHAALQTLLLRALIAHFAQRPGSVELIHWGNELHDRFMLPHVLWDDLCALIRELQRDGIPLQTDWFKPFLDLRFPELGRVQVGTACLELRGAHEPWPVLSEEAGLGGMARFIDSACDRVQVRVTGITPSRHVVVCNGRRVPLQPTARRGEFVAGVRYKVWNPPATLHPTVPAVRELAFDLVDTWNGTSLGGCSLIPERPGIWGGAAPAISPTREPMLRRDTRSAPAVVVPPWTGSGRFVPQGRNKESIDMIQWINETEHPYLLDLTAL